MIDTLCYARLRGKKLVTLKETSCYYVPGLHAISEWGKKINFKWKLNRLITCSLLRLVFRWLRWNKFRDFFQTKIVSLACRMILSSVCTFIPYGFCKSEPSAGPQCDWFVCRCRLSCCWSQQAVPKAPAPLKRTTTVRPAGLQVDGDAPAAFSFPRLFSSLCILFYILKLVPSCQFKPLIIFI